MRPRGRHDRSGRKRTFEYLKGRQRSRRRARTGIAKAVAEWKKLPSDPGAKFRSRTGDRRGNPGSIRELGNEPRHGGAGGVQCARSSEGRQRSGTANRLSERSNIADLKAGTPFEEILIDRVFIGSCTNGRIEDLARSGRLAAGHVASTHVSGNGGVSVSATGKAAGGRKKAWTASSARLALTGASRAALAGRTPWA